MGKVHLQIEFDSVDEMINTMGNRPMQGIITEEVPPEPQKTNGTANGGETRKRRAFLRHADGSVLETWDQSIVDECLANGGERITKQEFDAAFADPPEQSEPEPTPEPGPTANDAPVTFDTVRDVVKELNGTKGIDTVLELLKEFGVARVSELEESDYAAFVARVRELLNG